MYQYIEREENKKKSMAQLAEDDDQHRDSQLVKVQGVEACRISVLNGAYILYVPAEVSGIIMKEEPGRL